MDNIIDGKKNLNNKTIFRYINDYNFYTYRKFKFNCHVMW